MGRVSLAISYLDGKLHREHTLPQRVSGRNGFGSKADSHVCFDDFAVAPADRSAMPVNRPREREGQSANGR